MGLSWVVLPGVFLGGEGAEQLKKRELRPHPWTWFLGWVCSWEVFSLVPKKFDPLVLSWKYNFFQVGFFTKWDFWVVWSSQKLWGRGGKAQLGSS